MTLYLVTEDVISDVVVRKMLQDFYSGIVPKIVPLGRNGRGYIKSRINEFNKPGNNLFFVILIDLDTDSCAPTLKEQWLSKPCRKNLIFRIAVREIESWLLADTKGFSRYLNMEHELIKKEVNSPDVLLDPKLKLISLVNRSKKRELKKDIIRIEGSSLRQGPGYNTRLSEYVHHFWSIKRAREKSDSLERAINAISKIPTSQTLSPKISSNSSQPRSPRPSR